jgi:putative DNA primase/helicase
MEHSPSGKGLYIFFKATGFTFDKTKYYINNRKLGVEVYVTGATNRFVTVTGNVYANGDIAKKSNELQMILDKYMLRPAPVKQLVDIESQSYLSDKSVIEKALKSANGERFKALWQGNTSGYASASEADYYKFFARFVPERKMWFCYENGIWIPDVGNLKVMEMCKSLANQLLTL